MQSAATGVGDGGFGHWHLSRIRRPYRTRGFQGIPTRHCVPGFDDPSRWDEEREMGIKIRASAGPFHFSKRDPLAMPTEVSAPFRSAKSTNHGACPDDGRFRDHLAGSGTPNIFQALNFRASFPLTKGDSPPRCTENLSQHILSREILTAAEIELRGDDDLSPVRAKRDFRGDLCKLGRGSDFSVRARLLKRRKTPERHSCRIESISASQPSSGIA